MSRLIAPLAASLGVVQSDWQPVLNRWRDSDTGWALIDFVDRRLAAGATVFPMRPLRALELTALHEVRVVILGQDPYHGVGQAEGLAFSVPDGVRIPPSLRNIFKELARDVGLPVPTSGHLGAWARRGVLLLNTSLTVEEGVAASHAKKGWEALTDQIVATTAAHPEPKVFLLWGGHAQAKLDLIRESGPAHLVLCSNHPSPLSASRPPVPFVGCGHFSLTSKFLSEVRHEAWCWTLT